MHENHTKVLTQIFITLIPDCHLITFTLIQTCYNAVLYDPSVDRMSVYIKVSNNRF